ncbi:MAG: PA14 domain-containing protein [Chthoniobacter sp.]
MPRLDDAVPTAHGTSLRPDLAVSPRSNDIALLFTGYLEAPADGEYRFHVTTDTGALLRVHDATVVDADFGYAPGSEATGAVRLQAGRHPFRLYYARRHAGEPRLTWQWSRDGQPQQDIPASAFSHDTTPSLLH